MSEPSQTSSPDNTTPVTGESTVSPVSQQDTSPTIPATSTPSPSITSDVPTTPPAMPTTTTPAPKKSGGNFLWIFILIILFLGFLALAIWYFQSQLQKSSVINPTQKTAATTTVVHKKLIIGIDPTFQPMEYTQNGKMMGYDIDLANLLAKQLGIQVQFKNIVFDNLFTALEKKQIDMIISAVTITSERQKKYDFSKPYLNAGQVIITQKSNTVIKSPQDLKNKKIGVQQGTTDETEALKYTTNNLVIRYPDFVQATKALVDGNVDAIITDLPSAQGIVGTNPTLKIASDPFTNDFYGVVFRKGDPEVQKVNAALDSLSVRGYLTDLKHKWLD